MRSTEGAELTGRKETTMAFEKVRLTHPKGKYEDVVANSAIELNNFLYRDGYKVAEDQSNLVGEDQVQEEAPEQGQAATPAPAAQDQPDPPPPVEKRTPKTAKGTATNAEGDTVVTA